MKQIICHFRGHRIVSTLTRGSDGALHHTQDDYCRTCAKVWPVPGSVPPQGVPSWGTSQGRDGEDISPFTEEELDFIGRWV